MQIARLDTIQIKHSNKHWNVIKSEDNQEYMYNKYNVTDYSTS